MMLIKENNKLIMLELNRVYTFKAMVLISNCIKILMEYLKIQIAGILSPQPFPEITYKYRQEPWHWNL